MSPRRDALKTTGDSIENKLARRSEIRIIISVLPYVGVHVTILWPLWLRYQFCALFLVLDGWVILGVLLEVVLKCIDR